MIVYHAPKIGKYGGLVAAPVFKSVAERIIAADLSIAPDRKQIKRDKKLIDQLMVDIKTSSVSTSKSYFNIDEKKNDNEKRRIFNNDKSVMPDLLKLTMRDAVALLNDLGIQYKITGTGNVVAQSIEAGSVITPGLFCLIKCEPDKKLNSVRIN